MTIPADQVSPFPHQVPFAYRIDEFVRLSGIGRTKVYEALKKGNLTAVKCGARTLILEESARRFLSALPPYHPQTRDAQGGE
jgi:hypothetical protein